MPYTKSYRRYRSRAGKTRTMGGIRKGFRGTRFRRRPMTSGRVKRIIDAELKVRDLGVGPVDIPAGAGSVVHISNIGQGDLNTERNGNWIKPTSFMGTITLQGNEVADAGLVPQFRVAVVCWKENQTLNPLELGKLVQDTFAPHQQFNIENKGQFKVLWSRTGILSNQDINPQYLKVLRFYVKPPMKVLYDNAAFKNNHLFIVAFSDVDAAANPPMYSFDTRLRYTDS